MKNLYKDYLDKMSQRNKKILELKQQGKSLQYIANKFGITKQRIAGIIERELERIKQD